jgi:hypothetical protein
MSLRVAYASYWQEPTVDDRNRYMLKGRLARRGFDWWWHSLGARPRGRTACGQRVHAASDRVDKQGTIRSRRIAPTLPTLMHPLPTLRRTTPAANRTRLRRENNKILDQRGTHQRVSIDQHQPQSEAYFHPPAVQLMGSTSGRQQRPVPKRRADRRSARQDRRLSGCTPDLTVAQRNEEVAERKTMSTLKSQKKRKLKGKGKGN